MSTRRWLGPVLLLVSVMLIGTGIIGILRVSYMQHPSWALVILPPVEVIIGAAVLLIPILRRMSRELPEQENSEPRAAKPNRPPQSR